MSKASTVHTQAIELIQVSIETPPNPQNWGGQDCQEETRKRGEGKTRRHRCGGGLNRPPIGNHQIADFDGGLLTLGAYRPGRGAWDTERDPSGVSGAKECVIRLKVPQVPPGTPRYPQVPPKLGVTGAGVTGAGVTGAGVTGAGDLGG